MAGEVRARVVFRGTVQGVGFRYTARRLAAGSPTRGFVRNLLDGTVELVAEGPRREVASLIEAVERTMAGYISAADVTWSEAVGEFEGFEVRF